MRRGILGVACLLVVFVAFAGSAQAARYNAHTVIVKFASGASTAERAALLSSAGATGTSGRVAGVGADVVADIDAPEGWDAAGLGAFPASGGTTIGIVDTGIDQTHPKLSGKVLACADGLGGVVIDGECTDDSLHGTHVAGTIAAKANNATGRGGRGLGREPGDLQGAARRRGRGPHL
jgi:subtilisin family serine protease